ncbi:MAG: PIN domain-containing protein [Firmicutes bacterium]|nr:PIN domain-containing protein [Bacillota bacterium]
MDKEAETIIRAVCDTSVLVPSRYRKKFHQAAEAGLFVPMWSPWIIGELYRVLSWKWAETHGTTDEQWRVCSEKANTMMLLLEQCWTLVDSRQPWPLAWSSLEDEFDKPVFATAVRGGAHYVVSNNTHDFLPANKQGRHVWQGIEYMTAPVFLSDVLRI